MSKVDLLKTDYIRKKEIANPLLTKKSPCLISIFSEFCKESLTLIFFKKSLGCMQLYSCYQM